MIRLTQWNTPVGVERNVVSLLGIKKQHSPRTLSGYDVLGAFIENVYRIVLVFFLTNIPNNILLCYSLRISIITTCYCCVILCLMLPIAFLWCDSELGRKKKSEHKRDSVILEWTTSLDTSCRTLFVYVCGFLCVDPRHVEHRVT